LRKIPTRVQILVAAKTTTTKKKTCRQPEKIVVGRWLVAPVVGLGPPVRG